MSLALLLPEKQAAALHRTWPDEPAVYDRTNRDLDYWISPTFMEEWAFSGCVPAHEVAVMDGAATPPKPSINANGYMSEDRRTDGDKLRRLYERGMTIRLGNLQRVVPYLSRISRAVQQETGYSNYVHAFLTPAGGQGLRHHWDQQLAIITQMSGTKTWDLWAPVVEAPMRMHNESTLVWREEWREKWTAAGPDISVELSAGQSLVLPRGWVHNPHSLNAAEPSLHLTFAIRERTRMWLAEQLLAQMLGDPWFREIVEPVGLSDQELPQHLAEVCAALRDRLDGAVTTAAAQRVRAAALTELEYRT